MTLRDFSLEIANARLIYQQQSVFSDLNFTLEDGAWTCLLGASGVGKSSLLRMIAGLPTGGAARAEIYFKHDIHRDNIRREQISYMAQTDLLLPWLSSLDNVLISVKLQNKKILPAMRERALAMLEAVGLSDAAFKKPAELSGGMRQRVALARTMFLDRPVVLMDEPFAALDAVTKWRLQALAAKLLVGKTVLLITHDPLEALRLGQHIYVLAGKPAKLLNQAETIQPLRDLLNAPTPREADMPELMRCYDALMRQLEKIAGEE